MQLLTTLQLELTNIQDIYKSNKATIVSAINLLNSNQLQPHYKMQKKPLTFPRNCTQLAHGNSHNQRYTQHQGQDHQLIVTQSSQHDTLVHIVSILNVTHYATQVNRHSINKLINAVHIASQDIENLYNVTTSLASSISFNQMILHIRSEFANLRDSIHYLRSLSTHTKDYIDAATSGILSLHVLPVADLQKMLQHIADTLPPTLHHWTPCTSIDTYVHTS